LRELLFFPLGKTTPALPQKLCGTSEHVYSRKTAAKGSNPMGNIERRYRGQVYRLIGNRPHICRNGREVQLEVWQSRCAECGAVFTFTRSAEQPDFMPNRRCAAHKAPGRRVG
jgi:hypothetical protein